ncbi:Uncharacterized protein APZ42_007590, partial [Daphnia magna]
LEQPLFLVASNGFESVPRNPGANRFFQEIAEEAEESKIPKSNWTHRMSEINQDWASVNQNFPEAFVSLQYFVASWCTDCQDPVLQHYICSELPRSIEMIEIDD